MNQPQGQLTQRWRQHQQNIQQQQYVQERKQHKGIPHAYTVNLQAQRVEPAPQQQRQAVQCGMQGLEAPISARGSPETGGEDEDMERGQQPPAPQRQHGANERKEHLLEVVVPVGCVSGQQIRVQAPCGLVVVTQSVHMNAPPWCGASVRHPAMYSGAGAGQLSAYTRAGDSRCGPVRGPSLRELDSRPLRSVQQTGGNPRWRQPRTKISRAAPMDSSARGSERCCGGWRGGG